MFSKTDVEKYFNNEKQGSLVFLIIGMLAVLAAIVCFCFVKTSVYKGAAIPLAMIGVLLAVTGFVVYRRSDSDRVRNVYAYDMNPAELQQKELPRMQKVMRNFVILRYTEILLFLVGAALYIYYIRDLSNGFWRGFGIGLAIMAFAALVADHYAERRGREYLEGIRSFTSKS